MSRKFLTNIDLNSNQLLNAVVQNLGSDPGSPVEGQIWHNTTDHKLKYYNGTATIILYDAASTNTSSKLVLRDGSGNFAANVGTFASVTISNTPSSASDATTKSYVDSLVQGLTPKGSVRLATAAALAANTYSNGSSGVGATLTASGNGALSVDGVAVAVGDLILVKDEASGLKNGIYAVTAAGGAGAAYVLTRATNFDIAAEIAGGYVFVSEGSTNVDTGWIVSSTGPYTLGTTAITFAQFTAVANLSANAPLSKTGNTLSLNLNARLVNNSNNLDLQAGVVTPGTYALTTVDTYGRVTTGADLTSGTGLAAKTASGTYAARTITTASSSRITVGNGDGVSGNPTLDLAGSVIASPATYYGQVTVDTYGRVTAAGDLISSNGLAVRTGSGTFTNRSIGQGTGISVTNADGSAGNPTVAIDTSVVARKFNSTLSGNGSISTFTLTHNFNTTAVMVQVRDSSGNGVEVDHQANGVNTCLVSFATAPANGVNHVGIVIG
jgi:hypothetical protein